MSEFWGSFLTPSFPLFLITGISWNPYLPINSEITIKLVEYLKLPAICQKVVHVFSSAICPNIRIVHMMIFEFFSFLHNFCASAHKTWSHLSQFWMIWNWGQIMIKIILKIWQIHWSISVYFLFLTNILLITKEL